MNLLRSIPNYPGYFITKDGQVWSHKSGWLELSTTHNGYCRVTLYKDGVASYHSIHRLVLETYVGLCPKGLECCHNNGVKTDNRLKNLRWDTRQANIRESKGPKLNAFLVRLIREFHSVGLLSQRELARMFDMGRSTIRSVINKKSWKDVS